MKYFPLFADLDKGARAGGRRRRAGDAEGAAAAGRPTRRITVVAEAVTDELRELEEGERHLDRAAHLSTPRPRRPAPRLCRHRRATEQLDATVSRAAKARGIAVNVVDAPGLSTFIMPAVVDRAPVTVAIGTEGAAPVLAREIETQLKTLRCHQILVRCVAAPPNAACCRRRSAYRDARSRRRLWERLLQGCLPPARHPERRGGRGRPHPRVGIAGAHRRPRPSGRVALIGCGPGDPDLLTLKALQRLQEADVLVVDRLVQPPDTRLRPPRCRAHFRRQDTRSPPPTSQTEIWTCASWCARRQAGGSLMTPPPSRQTMPFIFGRAAEEMAALQTAGIAVEVVPPVLGDLSLHHPTASACRSCCPRAPASLLGRHRHHRRRRRRSRLAGAHLAPNSAFAVHIKIGNTPLLREQPVGRRRRSGNARRHRRERHARERTRHRHHARTTSPTASPSAAIAGPAVIFVGLDWDDAGLCRPESVTVHRRRRQPAATAHGQTPSSANAEVRAMSKTRPESPS